MWNDVLAEKGAAVVRGRMRVLGEIADRARELYNEILPGEEDLAMRYICSFDPGGEGGTDELRNALVATRETEVRRGYTVIGPHYDDVSIVLQDVELRRYGSQGRKRLMAIVLKLAQAATIMRNRTERPIVLLDDIFSELDGETAQRLRALVSDKFQSFITTPRTEDLPRSLRGRKLIFVDGGVFDENP
jgi:DNA replication and repair protein RecF